MATISGRVIFDRDRSVTVSAGDSGLTNIPVVLQNINTAERLTVLTDSDGNYTFLNVPDGSYRIVESYGTPGGIVTPGDFNDAAAGSVPQGVNPPVTAAINPPTGTTNLDSVTPDTLLVTVSDSDLVSQNFFNGPVIYTPIETILDPCSTVSNQNLITEADGGTFGTFPQGTPANTGVPAEPYPQVTPDFTYVLPNPSVYAPQGGEYTVQNIMNNSMSTEIGAWWRIADHTSGNETGRMMIVNGYNPGAVFFRSTVAVQPDTNYLFTAWILNLFRTTGYPDPQLGVRILDQNGQVLYRAALSALIPVNVNAPEWREIGTVLNSRGNTSLTVEFISEGPEVIGNDYAIDDISFDEIIIPQFLPVKTADTAIADIGDVVTYTVQLTNTCRNPLTDLLFRDVIPGGLTFIPDSVTVNGTAVPGANPNSGFTLPDVSGSQTVTVTFQVTANTVPIPNPTINTAVINYSYTPVEGGIPGEFQVTSNEVPVEIRALADISVTKTATPSPVRPGNVLTYQITVSNAGPSPSVNTRMTDLIPSGLTNVEYSADGGTVFLPWNGSYSLGTLMPGESQTILIRSVVSHSAASEIVNTASVSSDTYDPNPENNTFSVSTPAEQDTGADLCIRKTTHPSRIFPCRKLFYILTVMNAGPETAVKTVVYDQLPEELDNPCYSLDNGRTWEPWTGSVDIGDIASDEQVTILISSIVNECARGCIRNAATVSSLTPDPYPSNNTDSVTVNICNCFRR